MQLRPGDSLLHYRIVLLRRAKRGLDYRSAWPASETLSRFPRTGRARAARAEGTGRSRLVADALRRSGGLGVGLCRIEVFGRNRQPSATRLATRTSAVEVVLCRWSVYFDSGRGFDLGTTDAHFVTTFLVGIRLAVGLVGIHDDDAIAVSHVKHAVTHVIAGTCDHRDGA